MRHKIIFIFIKNCNLILWQLCALNSCLFKCKQVLKMLSNVLETDILKFNFSFSSFWCCYCDWVVHFIKTAFLVMHPFSFYLFVFDLVTVFKYKEQMVLLFEHAVSALILFFRKLYLPMWIKALLSGNEGIMN